jgi:hypothetical protein
VLTNGPNSLRLDGLARTILPDDTTLTAAFDYPEVRAVQVTYQTAGGDVVTVAWQRKTKPMALAQITLGSNADTLTSWSSGTEVVLVRHSEPAFQLIMVRPSGTMLTISLGRRDHKPPVDVSEAVLESMATQKLDLAAADSIWR